MVRQYQELKSQHPGTLLFFRLGDFYELFFEDAVIGARELQITLTAPTGTTIAARQSQVGLSPSGDTRCGPATAKPGRFDGPGRLRVSGVLAAGFVTREPCHGG